MPFKEPTDVFFNSGALSFSRCVTLQLASGDASIQAIFDDPFFDTQAGDMVVDTRRPMLTARECDVASLTRGAFVAVPTSTGVRTYSVIEVRPDGTGISHVELAYEQ